MKVILRPYCILAIMGFSERNLGRRNNVNKRHGPRSWFEGNDGDLKEYVSWQLI